MLEGLKRWFGAGSAAPRGFDALGPWAESKQYAFRGVRASDGFVIDCVGAAPWRLEWGPSQRAYIVGGELRLRAELGLSGDLQALVLNRVLQERMEREVFDQYVEGVQTRIDDQTPPEARWLVMYPKLGAADLGRLLRDRWVALSSIKPWLTAWLDGPLAAAFAALKVEPTQPTVLMIGRGRLTLRTALSEPDARDLEPWIRFFETAVREARRVQDEGAGPDTTGTQPSTWSATALPHDNAL